MNIYLKLFLIFFKIGSFAFGGGYGMIPVMKQEVVSQGWLTEEAFLEIIGLSESTPGPIAVNMATYVGTFMGGFWGGIIATIGAILPAFLIMYFVAKILEKFQSNKYIKAFLDGVKPVFGGFIIAVGAMLILKNIRLVSDAAFHFNEIDYIALIITAVSYLSIILYKKIRGKKLSPILTILISAALGVILYSI